jgi:hypothetical protein
MIVRHSRLIALSLFVIFSLTPLCLVRPTEAGSLAPLFFSEYAEGSSNHKYFEIYNPTNDTIDLSGYAYANTTNTVTDPGTYEYWSDFDSGAVILPNGVYVVAHPSADPKILAEADETHYYMSNGDDGYGLVHGTEDSYVVLDWIGNWDADPGSGWDVAGVSAATKDHTLVRKSSVLTGNTSWTNAAGADAENSEWLVFDKDSYISSNAEYLAAANLGDHTVASAPIPEPAAVLLVLFGLSWASLLKLRSRQA